MSNPYIVIQEINDRYVKDLLSNPSVSRVHSIDKVLDAVNNLVDTLSPESCVDSTPAAIIGMTPDNTRVVYRGHLTPGEYYAVPYDTLHQKVSRMVQEAQTYYQECETKNDNFLHRNSGNILTHATKLLEDLVALKPQ